LYVFDQTVDRRATSRIICRREPPPLPSPPRAAATTPSEATAVAAAAAANVVVVVVVLQGDWMPSARTSVLSSATSCPDLKGGKVLTHVPPLGMYRPLSHAVHAASASGLVRVPSLTRAWQPLVQSWQT